MQPWPFCSFATLRHVLTTKAGCDCVLVARAGSVIDLNGEPTPDLYGFTRDVDGEPLLAVVAASGDEQYLPFTVIRYVCAALQLDIALFDRPN